jgi:LysM repeat protein
VRGISWTTTIVLGAITGGLTVAAAAFTAALGAATAAGVLFAGVVFPTALIIIIPFLLVSFAAFLTAMAAAVAGGIGAVLAKGACFLTGKFIGWLGKNQGSWANWGQLTDCEIEAMLNWNTTVAACEAAKKKGGKPGPGPAPGPSGPSGPSGAIDPCTTYTVAQGDILYRIAKRSGTTIQTIMAANPQIKDADKIEIGDQIKIPSTTGDPCPAETPAKTPGRTVIGGDESNSERHARWQRYTTKDEKRLMPPEDFGRRYPLGGDHKRQPPYPEFVRESKKIKLSKSLIESIVREETLNVIRSHNK